MERFLCLDIGDKRIGVAVSDPFNTYALPVKTYVRKNLKTDLSEIGKIAEEKSATAIVCGLPVSFDGTPSVQTEKAAFFIEKLKEELNIGVFTADERCTTTEAEETLIGMGKSREERKKCVDALAACAILEGFLADYNKNNKDIFKENNMDKEKKHNHEHERCDCGCEHEHEHCDCGSEDDIVELTTDDGRKLKFYFVGTIEYKGKNYSAFEPAEEMEGVSEDDLIIFELSGDDEETADLLPIEDEKLLDEVFEEFCKALDEEEDYEEEK